MAGDDDDGMAKLRALTELVDLTDDQLATMEAGWKAWSAKLPEHMRTEVVRRQFFAGGRYTASVWSRRNPEEIKVCLEQMREWHRELLELLKRDEH